MALVIDSFAWVEYFKGTEEGRIVKDHIDKGDMIYTPINVLAEVYGFFKGVTRDFEFAEKVIKSKSEIYHFNENDWKRAIDIKWQWRKTRRDFGLMDALVLACAEKLNARIITGNIHFRAMKNVIFIG